MKPKGMKRGASCVAVSRQSFKSSSEHIISGNLTVKVALVSQKKSYAEIM